MDVKSLVTFSFITSGLTFSSGLCFHGTCGFTCHCANNSLCRDDVTCICDEGSAGVPWSGGGCQIGNVAFGKDANIRNPIKKFDGTNVASNCNDGNHIVEASHNTCCGFKGSSGSGWSVELGSIFAVESVLVYGSKKKKNKYHVLQNLGIYTKLRSNNSNYEECGMITGTDKLQTIYCSNKLATEIKLNKTDSKPHRMCEVVVIGYEYKECKILHGEYYYGPGCLFGCNCAEQCDFITGECSTCKTGYHQYNKSRCSECKPGSWGEQCNHKCNCKVKNEKCDHVTGDCKFSGCKEWYAQVGCDYRLAKLGNTQLELELRGTEVNISFTSAEYGSENNTVYQLIYRENDDWTLASQISHITSNRRISFKRKLPEIKVNYTLCVVPYDINVEMDGEKACVHVFTDCLDYTYGEKCEHKCTCKDSNEVCNKISGKCLGCKDGIIGDACTIISPTDDDVTISYVSNNSNTIAVDIYVYQNYSEMYSIVGMMVEVLQNNSLYESFNITINDTKRYTRVIENIEGSQYYELSATPFINTTWPDIKTYKGNQLFNRQIFVTDEIVIRNSVLQSSPNKHGSSNIIIIAICVAFLVFTVVVVMSVLKYRQHLEMRTETHKERNISHTDTFLNEQFNNHNITNDGINSGNIEHRYIKTLELKLQNIDDSEFNSLSEKQYPSNVGDAEVNKDKHRYTNIKAFDHNRVVLEKINHKEGSDYINASYIKGHEHQRFIASQAPRKCTINDMWRMIWQENISYIVMLTNLKELNRIKCQRYWPESGTYSYHNIKVELETSNEYSFFAERQFIISCQNEFRTLTQIQYTNWPDHGVPNTAAEILYLYFKIKSQQTEESSPMLVHCSAGVGRTGTFIALDILLEQSKTENVDVFQCVNALREQRFQMVQTDVQYRFLHELLYEALCFNHKTFDLTNLSDDVIGESPSGQLSALKEQYDILNNIYKTISGDTSEALCGDNEAKNRSSLAVPSNKNRLYLTTQLEQHNDYINAVRCDSFCKKDAFIMTQVPLEHTVPDLWILVYDHSVSTIVLLNELNSEEPYWSREKQQYGPISIQLIKESCASEGITLRDFELKHEDNPSDIFKIRQYHLNIWQDETELFNNVEVLKSLRNLVVRRINANSKDDTVLIQCMDGVVRSSLFIMFYNVIEMSESFQPVDINFALKQLRSTRSQALDNFKDYVTIHNWIKEVRKQSNIYVNT